MGESAGPELERDPQGGALFGGAVGSLQPLSLRTDGWYCRLASAAKMLYIFPSVIDSCLFQTLRVKQGFVMVYDENVGFMDKSI